LCRYVTLPLRKCERTTVQNLRASIYTPGLVCLDEAGGIVVNPCRPQPLHDPAACPVSEQPMRILGQVHVERVDFLEPRVP
jgi:hypothetical protein